MHIKSLTLAAIAAGVTPCLSSLQSAETTGDQTIIVVTAERRDTDLARSTSVTEVITPQDVAEAGHPFNTFDLFRSLPGVDVVEINGGIDGSTTSIRLRGGRAQDTRYLLDGIPINDPTAADGAVNASVIPSTGLDRIEVVKGAQSGLYGANAVGGVVNLISRRPTAEHQAEGLVEGGSFGTLRGAAGASGPLSKTLGYAVDVDGLTSKGFSVTTQKEAQGNPNGNEADGLKRGGARGRLEWTPSSSLMVYGALLHQATNQDYDTTGPNDDQSMLQSRLSRGSAGTTWQANKHVQLAVDAADTVQRRLYDDPSQMFRFVLHEQYLSSRVTVTPLTGLDLTAGGDGTWDQADADSYEASDHTVGGWGQIAHGGEFTELSATARRDQNAYAGGATTWRLAGAAFAPRQIAKAHGALGTGFVPPTLDQRFASYPGYSDPVYGYPSIVGNPELTAEKSTSREAGLTLKPASQIGASLDVTVWRTDYRDKIVYVYGDQTASRPSTYQNVTNGQVRGVETAAVLDDADIPLKARVSATWQWFEDDEDKLQRLLPQDKARFELGWRFPSVWIGSHVDAIGSRWNINGTDRDLPGYAVVGATVSWDINQTWTVYARGENVTNTRYEVNPSSYQSYTSAPISGYSGVIAHF